MFIAQTLLPNLEKWLYKARLLQELKKRFTFFYFMLLGDTFALLIIRILYTYVC